VRRRKKHQPSIRTDPKYYRQPERNGSGPKEAQEDDTKVSKIIIKRGGKKKPGDLYQLWGKREGENRYIAIKKTPNLKKGKLEGFRHRGIYLSSQECNREKRHSKKPVARKKHKSKNLLKQTDRSPNGGNKRLK